MASLEDRVTALENDRTTARREHAALTELLAASILGIHREFELMEQRNARHRADVKEEFSHLKEDVAAILKILNEQFRKS
jgi:hypothetical protein